MLQLEYKYCITAVCLGGISSHNQIGRFRIEAPIGMWECISLNYPKGEHNKTMLNDRLQFRIVKKIIYIDALFCLEKVKMLTNHNHIVKT